MKKNPWDSAYQKGHVFTSPYEPLVAFVKRTKLEKETALDLGCGTGRHIIFLNKAGFNKVHAIDSSKVGLKFAKEWAKSEKINNLILKWGDIYKTLPYKSDLFDFVLSIQVIYHNFPAQINNLLKEIQRIMKPKATFYFTVTVSRKISMSRNGGTKYKKVDKYTFLPLDGREKGLPHSYLHQKEWIKMLKEVGFKKIKIKHDGSNHYIISCIK